MYMLGKHVHAQNHLIYSALSIKTPLHVHVCTKFKKKIALVIPTLQKRIVLQLLDTGETGAANRPPIMFLFFMLKYNILFRIAKVRKNDENPNIFREKQSISLKNSNPAYHAF